MSQPAEIFHRIVGPIAILVVDLQGLGPAICQGLGRTRDRVFLLFCRYGRGHFRCILLISLTFDRSEEQRSSIASLSNNIFWEMDIQFSCPLVS